MMASSASLLQHKLHGHAIVQQQQSRTQCCTAAATSNASLEQTSFGGAEWGRRLRARRTLQPGSGGATRSVRSIRCSARKEESAAVDKRGAGMSWVSPNWLTSIMRVVGKGKDDESGIPIAAAKLEDVQDLLGGALFLPLFKWMMEEGPVYRLSAGPRNFVIVGDPAVAKHVLKNYGKTYAKGLVAEVAEFLFGSGFAIAEGQLWTVSARTYSHLCLSVCVSIRVSVESEFGLVARSSFLGFCPIAVELQQDSLHPSQPPRKLLKNPLQETLMHTQACLWYISALQQHALDTSSSSSIPMCSNVEVEVWILESFPQ